MCTMQEETFLQKNRMAEPPVAVASRKQTAYSVPPVERAMLLLRYIGDGNRCRNLSVAARDLGINRTTLLRLLHTLKNNRMVEDIGGGAGFRLGTGLISLAAQAIDGREIVQVCQPLLVELTRVTRMSSHLGILDGNDVVYVSRETPNTQLISNIRAGFRLPAHASAIGRAILTAMSNDEIVSIYKEVELSPITDKTPTTMQSLLEQTRADREHNVVWSRGNFEPDIGSCAAVVLDHTAAPAGGINVSGPVQQFADPEDPAMLAIKDAVLKAAGLTSAALGYRSAGQP